MRTSVRIEAKGERSVSASEKRALIGRMLGEGLSQAEIGRRLGLTKSTVSYHARRLGLPVKDECARRYDWTAVQTAVDEGLSLRELHHVNGRGNDNRLENLQLLCGNCHSQTDNWGGRGIRRKAVPAEQVA